MFLLLDPIGTSPWAFQETYTNEWADRVSILCERRSPNLISIASRHQRQSVVVADMLDLPHPSRMFDFALCVAAIHHLSTAERRVQGVKSLLGTLKPRGSVLIYVWALEQESSRRGWSEKDDQDVMVPWVMRGTQKERVFHRYYHLYRQGELEADVLAAGGQVAEAGYEKDNWWVIARPG